MSSSQPTVLEYPEAQRLRDGQLTSLLEALPAAAALFHRDGYLVTVNRDGRDAFVVDANAPLASQQWGVVLQPLGAPALEAIREARAGGAAETRTITNRRTGRSVDLRAVPFDETLVLVSMVDVTEREALARSAIELKALLDAVPASVRIIDLTGRIERQNGAAAAEHGEPPPVDVRALWEREAPHDIANNRPLAFLDLPALRALAGHAVQAEYLEVRRSDARRVVEAYAAPLYGSDGRVRGAVLVDLDVTDRDRSAVPAVQPDWQAADGAPSPVPDAGEIERLVEERSRAFMATQEEQVRERRLSAVGQLAAGVMHDVNNALNPIMAAAYLLRHHAESPEAVRDYADRIRKAAEIGAATASRVGRFIRQEPLHAGGDEEVDLSVLAEEVLDLTEPMRLRRSSESGAVHIERSYEDGVRTRGIPGEIREALLNLVQNAIDAMPDGGTITVRTMIEGAAACVAVRDTGVGMSVEVRERAFEPFFSTKGAKGSGLGLAEVYGIARRHRGIATISSVVGQGTEIMLRLPALQSPAAPALESEEKPTVPRHILVVEDHDDGREFLRRILHGDGHRVDAVGSCAEARGRLEASASDPYDLMLTDVGLPDGSGWDLVRQAKADHPGLRVGVITGWEPMVGTDDARDAEFVLRKPLRAAELKAHIGGTVTPASKPTG